jgi:hypothetical protein
MELDRPYSSNGKCNREGGFGVEPTRTNEKREAKEVLAENERKPWLLGRHGQKLNNSTRTV